MHLHFTRGPLDSASKVGGTNGTYGQQQQAAHSGVQDMSGNLGISMSAAARKVYQCLKTSPQTNEGLHQHDIGARLNMEVSDVAKAGDELLSMGVIYTTVDDATWAILEVD